MKPRLEAIFVCFLAASGCGSDPEPTVPSTLDAGNANADAGLSDAGCTSGEMRACSCPSEDGGVGLAGSQQCFQNNWLLCNCQKVDTTSVSTSGSCLPGYYAGAFEGEYRSGYQFGGTLKVSGALNLTLTQSQEGGGEFASYTISGGKVTGKANDRYPFEGTLTGELDCATKQFTGVLDGCYQVVEQLQGLLMGCFMGPMNAKYDAQSQTFVGGTWDVVEPNAVLFFQMLGGNGTWKAPYAGTMAPDDGGVVDSGLIPADAGSADAGP